MDGGRDGGGREGGGGGGGGQDRRQEGNALRKQDCRLRILLVARGLTFR